MTSLHFGKGWGSIGRSIQGADCPLLLLQSQNEESSVVRFSDDLREA